MAFHFERAIAFDDGEGQVKMALGIDAGRQAVELEAELPVAGGRALRRHRDGQRPFRRRAFDEDLDLRVGRRLEVDRDQRLRGIVDATNGEPDIGGGSRLSARAPRRP